MPRLLTKRTPREIVDCPAELGDIIKTLIFHRIPLLLWLSIYRMTHTSEGLKLMSEGGSGPLRQPNPWLQFNRDDRQDKGLLSLKDAKSDILLGFLLPTPAFDVKPHFILIMLVYKTTYIILLLYVLSLCASGNYNGNVRNYI